MNSATESTEGNGVVVEFVQGDQMDMDILLSIDSQLDHIRGRVAAKVERNFFDRTVRTLRDEDRDLEFALNKRIISLTSEFSSLERKVDQAESRWLLETEKLADALRNIERLDLRLQSISTLGSTGSSDSFELAVKAELYQGGAFISSYDSNTNV